ncbi:hypothetical protein AB0I72_22245 [Nocardiopsis sp. NPDC049922]|uniref:hypothetical protein n=1 Tax=Nocardiopsis sp. NPDC049922 TaxID=3155157 RepID=UPI0033EEBCF2
MGDVDWFKVFGIEPEDHKRWEEMEEDAARRRERGGGIGQVAEKAVESGLGFAQKAAQSRMDAAQHNLRDDVRATRPKRTRKVVEVEEQTEFTDEREFD